MVNVDVTRAGNFVARDLVSVDGLVAANKVTARVDRAINHRAAGGIN